MKNNSFKTVAKDIISFEVDLETARDFEDLIHKLIEMDVCMDFVWSINSKFNNDDTKFIHIEVPNKKTTWHQIGDNEYHYYKSKAVTVYLDYNPDLYFIFSSLYFNNVTNIIYDFYEGPDDIYVSFFVNKSFKEFKNNNFISCKDDNYNKSDIFSD